MSITTSGLYEFGPFRLDVEQRVFTRAGEVLPLAPKTFDLLVLFLQRPGHAFSKQELMSALWPDAFVEEANLSFQVSTLRKAMGDGAAHWIETIPKHGYRFSEDVRTIGSYSTKEARPAARRIAIAAGLLLAVGIGAGLWMWRRSVHSDLPEVLHRQVTFTGDVIGAAISPDGRSLVYGVGKPGNEIRIVVRDMAGGQTQPIWAGELVTTLLWVSDGSHVMVGGMQKGNGGTWIVPRLGGNARPVPGAAAMTAPAPDGKTFASTNRNDKGFNVFSSEGLGKRFISTTGTLWSRALDWHARTNRVVLLTSDDGNVFTIWSVALDGQEQTRLHAGQDPILAICSSPVSDVVYALRDRDGSGELVRIPMRGDANSAAVLLTGLPFSGNIARRCTVSADGRRLLYMRAASHANLWRLDLARAVAATKLTQGTRLFADAKVSPDGQWIASSMGPKSGYPSNTDNWATQSGLVKIPIGGGEPVGLGEGSRLAWSTNGQRVAFVSRRSGSLRVWIARTDVVGPEEVKDSAVSAQLPPIWLPDGRLAWPTPDHQNYRIRDLRTGEDEYLFKGDSFGWVFNPQFSPRGDYVALSWNRIKEPRGQNVWVLSWPGRAERRLTKGMLMPIGWSADGEWIYATGVATVFRVSFQTGKTEPVAQFPVETVGSSCDLFPDRSAVICSLVEQKSDAWIVENFDPEIR